MFKNRIVFFYDISQLSWDKRDWLLFETSPRQTLEGLIAELAAVAKRISFSATVTGKKKEAFRIKGHKKSKVSQIF